MFFFRSLVTCHERATTSGIVLVLFSPPPTPREDSKKVTVDFIYMIEPYLLHEHKEVRAVKNRGRSNSSNRQPQEWPHGAVLSARVASSCGGECMREKRVQ